MAEKKKEDAAASLADQAKQLGDEIAQDVFASLGSTVVLDAQQQGLVTRAAGRIAEAQILGIGADQATLDSLAWKRDTAYATLDNLEVADVVAVKNQLAASTQKVITRAFQIALSFLTGALTGGGSMLAGGAAAAIATGISEPPQPAQPRGTNP